MKARFAHSLLRLLLHFNNGCSKNLQRRNLNAKNTEYLDRIDRQNIEISNISSKLRESLAVQAILNEEVNEKTEEICQLHSEKSK